MPQKKSNVKGDYYNNMKLDGISAEWEEQEGLVMCKSSWDYAVEDISLGQLCYLAEPEKKSSL